MSERTGAHADIALRRFGSIARSAGVPISFAWEWEDDTRNVVVIKARSTTATPTELEELLSSRLAGERSVRETQVRKGLFVVWWVLT